MSAIPFLPTPSITSGEATCGVRQPGQTASSDVFTGTILVRLLRFRTNACGFHCFRSTTSAITDYSFETKKQQIVPEVPSTTPRLPRQEDAIFKRITLASTLPDPLSAPGLHASRLWLLPNTKHAQQISTSREEYPAEYPSLTLLTVVQCGPR